MTDEQVLASSVGKTQPDSVTFEVADIFLNEEVLADWSDPVQFKFERYGDAFNLVFRKAVDG